MSIKRFRIVLDGVPHEVEVEELGSAPSSPAAPAPAAPAPAAPTSSGGGDEVTAPMPGTIVNVPVTPGQAVKQGQVLAVLEAMKMENEIVAPRDGVVASVAAKKGDSVASGDLLLTLQ